MSRIISLPEPPYFAVIAPATLSRDLTGYPAMAERALTDVGELDGFLGIETCLEPEFAYAVSYWSSLDAIDAWRHHPTHQRAKEQGMSRWFTGYATRIAHVIEHY